MINIRPFLIIPNLVAQPTWGGEYIAKFKGISKYVGSHRIGQAYELYQHSNLFTSNSFSKSPFELGHPNYPIKTRLKNALPSQLININQLIKTDPQAVLGNKALKKHGSSIQILIKFTQAKGNSYQLHVKKKVGRWLPKPESSYFFEPGLITLGVKPDINWQTYQRICHQINHQAIQISHHIQSGSLSLTTGRAQLKKLILRLKPDQFVNLIKVKANQTIDLSAGGIHHSWEDHPDYPQGNIVYEVQKNVFDPVSTIRCFDKGNIKPDGSIRQLQIDDYFRYIDRSVAANDPKSYFHTPPRLASGSNWQIDQVFSSSHYTTDKITFSSSLSNSHTTTENSYHHLFVKQGKISLNFKSGSLILPPGFSAFIPANTGCYQFTSLGSQKSVILKTQV